MKKAKRMTAAVLAVCMLAGVTLGAVGCSGKKEIVFWNPFSGPDGETMQAMVDKFNETDTEYTIKNVSMAGDDMYTKLPTVINSGKNIPDMGIVHFFRIPLYASENMVVPIESYIAGQPEIKEENYIETAWQFGDFNGQRYSVPLDMTGWVTYYNVDLVEKYAPHVLDDQLLTLDEVMEIGEAAAKDGVYAFGGANFFVEQFMAYLAQMGTELSVEDKPNIDTKEAREIIQKMKDIYASGYSSKIGDDNLNLLISNKIIFNPEGTWTANALNKEDYPDLNWGETNTMALDNQTMLNWMSSHQFVVYNNTGEKEDVKAAKAEVMGAFIEFVRENSGEWANAGHIPASIQAASGTDFESKPQAIFMSSDEEKDSLTLPNYTYFGYISDALYGVMQDILTDKLPVDDGLAKAQAEVSDKIAEHAKAAEAQK